MRFCLAWISRQCRPWIVVVEATEPMSWVVTKDQWEDILTSQDYKFAYFDGLNCYYVAAEHDRLIEKLALAPNVFDDFVKIDELTLQTQAEKWRLELVETVAVSERAQDRLRQSDDALGSLEEQLGQERKSKVELELQCQQLATSLKRLTERPRAKRE